MKLFPLFFILTVRLSAQWIVNDPVNTTVAIATQANLISQHAAIIARWAQQLEQLNRQLRQLEAQLDVQQRIKATIGDPRAVGAKLVGVNLEADELLRTYGETLGEARRLANAIDSLRRTSEGIYQELDDRTSLRGEFIREEGLYLRYAAVERQADNLNSVQVATDARSAALQTEISVTLEALRDASTQAEVDKLAARLAALNGQLTHLDAHRRTEAEKLQAQQILNENQAAKERQDLLEKELAEERQSSSVAARWQEAVTLILTEYAHP
jgi:hypothetical protein